MADFKSAPKSLIRRLNRSISAHDRSEALGLAKNFPIIKIDGDRLILNRVNAYHHPVIPKAAKKKTSNRMNQNNQVFDEKKAIEEGLKLYPARDVDEDTVQSNPELWKYVEKKRKEFYQEKNQT